METAEAVICRIRTVPIIYWIIETNVTRFVVLSFVVVSRLVVLVVCRLLTKTTYFIAIGYDIIGY